jgi:antitoxin YefM
MKNISVTNDIVPIAEFKAGISKCFKNLQTSGHPLIITQNGKPAGVLLSPKDYDELVYRKSFFNSVEREISDAGEKKICRSDVTKTASNAKRNKERP